MATNTKSTKASKAQIDKEEMSAVNSFTEVSNRAVSEGEMEEKLRLLYHLQMTDSEIDKIHLLRGELPLEVQDLENDIEVLEKKIKDLQESIKASEKDVSNQKNTIEESKKLVERYKTQQDNVKNNREYDSISKEIEFQTLTIEYAEKRIKEFSENIKNTKAELDITKENHSERKKDLVSKKEELETIEKKTAQQEEELTQKSKELQDKLDRPTLAAYEKVRSNSRNGLAVVTIKRNACGGCFFEIPPQRQLDIKMNKKMIVCEYCGRIIVNDLFEEEFNVKPTTEE